MTGSAVFFTQVVGLSVVQVGLGLTIANIAGFLAAYPMGRVVDRLGRKRCWALSSAGQASLFAVWPFVDNFYGYVAMAVAMEVLSNFGNSAQAAYTIDVLPPDERVESRAYVYSAMNLGFTLGSLLGGMALAFESVAVLRLVPWLTASLFLINSVNIARLPKAAHDLRTEGERRVRIRGRGPLTNAGWLLTNFFNGVLWTHQIILSLVIPLWLVEKTDAPWIVLAFLFATNTIMCIFLPLAAARGIKDTSSALRAIRLSTALFIVSCVVTLSTHHTVGILTVALFFLGHVTLTGAELYLSAASWTFEAELMDPRRRGEYQGAAELSSTLGQVWAPAAYTFLAITWGSAGWLVIAAIIAIAAGGLHPSVRMARTFLERHVPPEVLSDARASGDPVEAVPVGPPQFEQASDPGSAS